MTTLTLSRVDAQPFLKWAGGKTQLLSQFASLYPERITRFVEPFVGSAAVFFDVRRRFALKSATLSDNNEDLINCYQVVRDRVDGLIKQLRHHQRQHHARDADYYYEVREQAPRDPVRRAARLIYLNKTCYNGLYRVNGRGRFNVPMGRYKNPAICDPDLLRRACDALQGVELVVQDFAESVASSRRGDFFYIDPPYDPLSATSNFTSYTKNGFGPDEQERLAHAVAVLDRRGGLAMVSNSDTALIRKLYRDFDQHRVNARRLINSNGAKRGHIGELVVLNYQPRTGA